MHLNKLLLVTGLLVLLYVVYSYCASEKYRFLGGMYLPDQGGYRAELNEECLQHPGVRQCMLTDGTSGTCVQSGHCVANMLVDLNLEDMELEKPYCTMPIFKEGCGRFCNCKEMKGQELDHRACVENCLSYFSPL